ncbi:MAG: YfiR family protein [Flavobacteriales bacterium]
MQHLLAYLLLPAALLFSGFHPEPGNKVDDANTRAIIKASYLYNFGTQCDWPPGSKDKHFQIAILGNDPVYTELATKYVGKPVGGQTLEVVLCGSTEDIDQPHILYVADEALADLADIAALVTDEPVMVVCESPGALRKGAMVNFVVEDAKIKFELNTEQAAAKGITLGSNIVHWAIQP